MSEEGLHGRGGGLIPGGGGPTTEQKTVIHAAK